jgi:hypothetical protein
MEEISNAYKMLVRKAEKKRSLRRARRKFKYSKVYFKEILYHVWMQTGLNWLRIESSSKLL